MPDVFIFFLIIVVSIAFSDIEAKGGSTRDGPIVNEVQEEVRARMANLTPEEKEALLPKNLEYQKALNKIPILMNQLLVQKYLNSLGGTNTGECFINYCRQLERRPMSKF